jgi:HipA-like protein
MREAEIYCKGILAGILTEENRKSYIFRYDDRYLTDDTKPAVSLMLPKNQQQYRSSSLFPFFFNMLSEGVNRKLQCRLLKIDEKDDFGLLMVTARVDTPGAVTVKSVLSG